MTKTAPSHTLLPKAKSVILELSSTPEKFLEDDLESSRFHSQGCLYPYLEKKKLLDGSIAFYPRVVCERDPNNPTHWRWGYSKYLCKINCIFALSEMLVTRSFQLK